MRVFFIIAMCFLMLACGGGGSSPSSFSNQSSTTQSAASSALISASSIYSSSSANISSVSDSILPIFKRRYEVEEDKVLAISTQGQLWDLVGKSGERTSKIITSSGAIVSVNYIDDLITYIPREDFFGEDSFVYQLFSFDANSVLTLTNVLASIHVKPVEDLLPKVSFVDKKTYAFNNTLTLYFPQFPDSKIVLEPDSSTQISLSGMPINFQVGKNTISFSVPSVERAGLLPLVYEQLVGSEKIRLELPVPIKIVDGEVNYYMGKRGLPGQVFALVRTDGVKDDDYKNWIDTHLFEVLNDPLLIKHQQYWTFAVIDAPAGTNLQGNPSGIMVADRNYYYSFVQQYLPGVKEIVVLDSQNFRASAGSIITMNIFDDAGVLLHELGHQHAWLGDEYADSNYAYDYSTEYRPNISFFRDLQPDNLAWRHWIKDPASIPGIHFNTDDLNAVGAFLGAHYFSDRYFRPTLNSLMKDSNSPMDSVGREAWVLATYQSMGLLDTVESVQSKKLNVISVMREWDPAVTMLDWYLDGEKIDEHHNHSQITIDENTISNSTYKITAKLTDISGLVRNPHAYRAFNQFDWGDAYDKRNHSFERTWDFVKPAGILSKKSEAHYYANSKGRSSGKWIEHVMSVDGNVHKLNASYEFEAQSNIPPVTGVSDLVVEVSTEAAGVMYKQGVSLQQFHQEDMGTPFRMRYGYTIRYPQVLGAHRVKIYKLPKKELIAEYAF